MERSKLDTIESSYESVVPGECQSQVITNAHFIDQRKGHGMGRAIECLVEAAEINTRHNMSSMMANQVLLEASLYSRLGQSGVSKIAIANADTLKGLTHLSESFSGLVIGSYRVQCSQEEIVKAYTRNIHTVGQKWAAQAVKS